MADEKELRRRNRLREGVTAAEAAGIPPEEIPKWDIALEAASREEHKVLGRPLTVADFQAMASRYSFRVHDFFATMSALVDAGLWRHVSHDKAGRPVDDEMLQNLYVHGRLDEELATRYSVTWEPAQLCEGVSFNVHCPAGSR